LQKKRMIPLNTVSEPTSIPSSLHVKPCRKLSRDSVLAILNKNVVAIPAFSASALRLKDLLKEQNVDMATITEIVKLDPGLTSQYLRAAQATDVKAACKKTTSNIKEALLKAGMGEVRKQATTIGVVDRVSNLRIKIDWSMYWLHSVLTARLTERIAGAYRPITGKEYLAGLLHDSGKVFMEHFFPQEFESVVMYAMERGCGMLEAEKRLLEITHPEISALLCEKWGLQREIVRSIRFHHEPNSPFNKDPIDPDQEKLLAACICVADILANICQANIPGAKIYDQPFETLPEYLFLKTFTARTTLELDVASELEKAQKDIQAAKLHVNGS